VPGEVGAANVALAAIDPLVHSIDHGCVDGPEIPLHGGSVTPVVRIGDTVRRQSGPWSEAVQALLRHLEAVGFTQAPRALGWDRQGREQVGFLPGAAATRPWPDVLRSLVGVTILGDWLARYHHAVAGFAPPPGAVWRTGPHRPRPGDIIRHGDLGPWNTIWQAGGLSGVIDWDFAAPGPAIADVADLAWQLVPLRPTRPDAPYEAALERRVRLQALCAAYGAIAPAAVVDAALALMAATLRETVTRGQAGAQPWRSFLARGDVPRLLAERQWLAQARCELIGS